MFEVKSRDKLPRDNYHVYHATSTKNLHDILGSGIKKSLIASKWCRVNKFLHLVREENSYQVGPNNRSESVFCYPRYAEISNTDDENLVFALDTREINQPIYTSSYHTVTKVHQLISSKFSMPAKDILESRVIDADAKKAYNLAKEYWENMENINPPIDKGGEVIIDGDVSCSAITHYSK